jgi:glycosyltransferase involved in cell wall biosynthesis
LAALLKPRLHGLVVCLSRSWGGLEQVAAQDSLDAGELGLRMRVLALEGSPIHQHLAHRPEVRVFPLDFRPRNHLDLKLRAVLRQLLTEGVNLIHTHQTSVLGSIVPWLWGHPQVAMIASRHIMNNHNKKNFFHQAIYSRVDSLIVMSRTLRANVLETHPVRERKVKVINLGLDFNRFNPATIDSRTQRAEWGADDETCVIGLVGRIDPAKGQDVFIKAAAGLLKGGEWSAGEAPSGQKLKFVIVGAETVGSERNYLEDLREMVRQFRLDEHVVFAGFKENIPEVMGAFDLFVMPSHQEAFGLVAIEAMAMECPIIISSGGSADEIVGEQEFGLTVRPNDAFDLQRQLRYMLDHPDVRAEMGRRARTHVIAHYDRAARIRSTLDLYERSLRRRGLG